MNAPDSPQPERTALLHDGQEILRGDALSIAIVYRNLRGTNLSTEEHATYLATIERLHGAPIYPEKLTLRTCAQDKE